MRRYPKPTQSRHPTFFFFLVHTYKPQIILYFEGLLVRFKNKLPTILAFPLVKLGATTVKNQDRLARSKVIPKVT